MKVKIYKSDADIKSDEKAAVILRIVGHLVCEYAYLVPNGWRLILKMKATSDSEPYCHIDIQSDKGGGSFAEVKMQTLEAFPNHAASGIISYAEIRELIINRSKDADDQELLEYIRKNGVESMCRS